LGDDILMKLRKLEKEKYEELSLYTQVYHNMKSTYSVNELCGIFCQMIFCEMNQTIVIGANLIRLEDRFKSIYEVNINTYQSLITKTISYCWLIGYNSETKLICNNYGVMAPWKLPYDINGLLNINSIYHKQDVNSIRNLYENLLYCMKTLQIKTVDLKVVNNLKDNTRGLKY
jgi:hypothetical protein